MLVFPSLFPSTIGSLGCQESFPNSTLSWWNAAKHQLHRKPFSAIYTPAQWYNDVSILTGTLGVLKTFILSHAKINRVSSHSELRETHKYFLQGETRRSNTVVWE